MNKYLLFGFEKRDPKGGANDLIMSFTDKDDIDVDVLMINPDWFDGYDYQIYNTETWETHEFKSKEELSKWLLGFKLH